jgi:hypothetical protein
LTKKEQDDIYLEVAEFLISEGFKNFASKVAGYVEDKETLRYLNIISQIKLKQNK